MGDNDAKISSDENWLSHIKLRSKDRPRDYYQVILHPAQLSALRCVGSPWFSEWDELTAKLVRDWEITRYGQSPPPDCPNEPDTATHP